MPRDNTIPITPDDADDGSIVGRAVAARIEADRTRRLTSAIQADDARRDALYNGTPAETPDTVPPDSHWGMCTACHAMRHYTELTSYFAADGSTLRACDRSPTTWDAGCRVFVGALVDAIDSGQSRETVEPRLRRETRFAPLAAFVTVPAETPETPSFTDSVESVTENLRVHGVYSATGTTNTPPWAVNTRYVVQAPTPEPTPALRYARCCGCSSRMLVSDMHPVMVHGSLQYVCDDCSVNCEHCDATISRYNVVGVIPHACASADNWCITCASASAQQCRHCGVYQEDPLTTITPTTFPNADHFVGRTVCNNCREMLRVECMPYADRMRARRRSVLARNDAEMRDDARNNPPRDTFPIVTGSGPAVGQYHGGNRRSNTRRIASDWTRQHGRYFGVELEVEVKNRDIDPNDVARDLLDVANDAGRAMWAEHDGSLSNGFELITQPMGLDRHRELWARVLSHPIARHCRSHKTDTCGLHVHVSRLSVSKLTIVKAIAALNSPEWRHVVKAIARRYATGYCNVNTSKASPKFSNLDSGNRYEMLNVCPLHTVEFRIFRGTMKPASVLACIEFCNALLNWCDVASLADLSPASFVGYLARPENAPDTHEVRAYLAARDPQQFATLAPRPVTAHRVATSTTSHGVR